MAAPFFVHFAAGSSGDWQIDAILPIRGPTLPSADRLAIVETQSSQISDSSTWTLCGNTSHARYTSRDELTALAQKQRGLGQDSATCAVLIPIKKNEIWWSMAQDERRAIMEEQSRHIAIGLDYLPAVARRLHHCRDLGEPFDFLTWFEFSPEHAEDFQKMLTRLRATQEWEYVEREVEIQVSLSR